VTAIHRVDLLPGLAIRAASPAHAAWYQIGGAMISALLLLKMDGWVTDEMKAKLQGISLANAKQLVCGRIRDEAIVDVAATTVEDLNTALGDFAEVTGVKSVTVARIIQQ
jgi:hypothetical protein